MNKKIYICYASSDFYSRETGISLLGFLENNPDYEPDKVIILDYGILDHNKGKLNSIAGKYGKQIEYVDAKSIMEKVQDELQLSNFRGSLATYSRAFIDRLMPKDVDNVLYIDSDTVVVGSISDVYEIDMENKCMAGIIHTGFYDGYHDDELKLLTGNEKYYGCGIVLFNVSNWRKYRCYDMISETLKSKKNYTYADQTLINNSIPEKLLQKLPLQFNYTSHTYNPNWESKMLLQGGWYTSQEAEYAIQHPVVIHYPGSPVNRPWYEGCLSYRKNDYIKYKSISPWSEDPLLSLNEYYQSNSGIGGRFALFLLQLKSKTKHRWIYKSMFYIYFFGGRIKKLLIGVE